MTGVGETLQKKKTKHHSKSSCNQKPVPYGEKGRQKSYVKYNKQSKYESLTKKALLK